MDVRIFWVTKMLHEAKVRSESNGNQARLLFEQADCKTT